MPLQNRVTPTGEIIANPARGTLMGNRGGALHGADRRIGIARWRSRQWIICVLCFKGRTRRVMAPNRYTELFFHDEPVALAAGHRPCAECQRAKFNAYAQAWEVAFGARPRAPQIDAALHTERVTRRREKITFDAPLHDLPDGVFILHHDQPHLLWQDALHGWSFSGYAPPTPAPRNHVAPVLTPAATVEVLRAGYATAPVGLS